MVVNGQIGGTLWGWRKLILAQLRIDDMDVPPLILIASETQSRILCRRFQNSLAQMDPDSSACDIKLPKGRDILSCA